jgi:CRP-like cAMP-binding protein
MASTIQVVHAQGVLDFAALEHLLAELESLPPHTNVLVLDFNQVLQLPEVSSRLLLSQLALLASQGIQTLMSRANHRQGLAAQAPDLEQLDSLDRALERAEDLVLQELPAQHEFHGLVPPPMLEAFSPEDRRLLETLMELKTYQPGERVLRKGERSDGLFFVADGQFSVLSRPSAQDTTASPSRLATLTAGMCFGEIGFLSGRPRSADVEADGLSHCWMLSRQMLDGLYKTQLDLWIRVVLRVSGELEEKLIRSTNQYVAQEENQ